MFKLANPLTVPKGDRRYLRIFSSCFEASASGALAGIIIQSDNLYFFDSDHPCPGLKLGDFDENKVVVDSSGNIVTANGNIVVSEG